MRLKIMDVLVAYSVVRTHITGQVTADEKMLGGMSFQDAIQRLHAENDTWIAEMYSDFVFLNRAGAYDIFNKEKLEILRLYQHSS